MHRILTVIVAISMFSCLGKRTQGSEKVTDPVSESEFIIIHSGEYSGISTYQNLCIKSEEDWKKCWKNIHSQSIPVPKLPQVNFEEDMLVACFMGSRNSGGYTISIDQIVFEESGVFVRVTHSTPGENCIKTMALSQPYVIIKIQKSGHSDCRFEQVEKVLNC